MTTNDTTTTTTNADDHAEVQATPQQAENFRAAFESLAAERDALQKDDLPQVNVNIPNAVNTVLGNFPAIIKLADEAKQLPGFDIQAIEKLDVYAEALAYAQMLYNAASKPVPVVPGLAEDVASEREKLVASANALAARGYLDPTRLGDLKGGPGYKSIAYDLGTLVAMLRAAWPKIDGKTAVTQDELTNAQVLTEKLLLAVAAREQQDAASTAAGEQRDRTFTLFANAYDQVRRAATYLRWGESLNQLVPSFYAGAASTGSHHKPTTPDAPPADKPAPSPTNGAAQPTDGAASPANGAAQPSNGASGMPGTSPFAAPGA